MLISLRREARGFVGIALLVLVFLGKGELSSTAYASESQISELPRSAVSSIFLSTLPAIQPAAFIAEMPAIVPEAPAVEAEPNRANCAEITGTSYLSHGERAWYIDNCMSPEARARLTGYTPAGTTAVAPEARGGSTIDQFVAGYRAAGGPEVHLNRVITRVIPCESGGNPQAVNRAGPFYGLMQFMPSTWNAVGGGDWFDPYQQGANTARLLQRANPATQWPVCWFR